MTQATTRLSTPPLSTSLNNCLENLSDPLPTLWQEGRV